MSLLPIRGPRLKEGGNIWQPAVFHTDEQSLLPETVSSFGFWDTILSYPPVSLATPWPPLLAKALLFNL